MKSLQRRRTNRRVRKLLLTKMDWKQRKRKKKEIHQSLMILTRQEIITSIKKRKKQKSYLILEKDSNKVKK